MRTTVAVLSLLIVGLAYAKPPIIVIAWDVDKYLEPRLVEAVQRRTLTALASKTIGNSVYDWRISGAGAHTYPVTLTRDETEAVLLADQRKSPRCRVFVLPSAAYSLYAPNPADFDIEPYLAVAVPKFARCLVDRASQDVPVVTGTEGMPEEEHIHATIQAEEPLNTWAYRLDLLEDTPQSRKTKAPLIQVPLSVKNASPRNFIRFLPASSSNLALVQKRIKTDDRVYILADSINPDGEARVPEGSKP